MRFDSRARFEFASGFEIEDDAIIEYDESEDENSTKILYCFASSLRISEFSLSGLSNRFQIQKHLWIDYFQKQVCRREE